MKSCRWIVTFVVILVIGGFLSATGTSEVAPADTGGQKLVTLKLLGGQDSFDPETDYTRTVIRDLLGYDIIPEMGATSDKINLVLSSGQEYDMIFSGDRNLLANLIANKAVQDLTDPVNEYGPNLLKYIPANVWAMVTSEGRYWALPEEAEGILDNGIIIRTDWLDELGMEMPSTVDEFYAMLKAFKEKDPAGVGRDTVIPLSFAGMGSDLGFNGFAQAFGIGRNLSEFVEDDGKLLAGLTLPGGKEYVRFLNRLYTEGLLDADFPATNGQALQTKIGSGNLGAAYGSVWQTAGCQAVLKEIPGSGFAYMPPTLGKNGERRISALGGIKEFTIVPNSSKKADEVVKFCNAFLDERYYKTIILGEEGVHHKVVEGKYYPVFPAFNDLNKGRWFYPVNAASLYLPLFAARAHKEERMGRQYDELNEFRDMSYIPPERFAPILAEQIEYGQKLTNFVNENIVKMVVDTAELEKYDAFVNEWNARGGEALTAAYNKWYAGWKK